MMEPASGFVKRLDQPSVDTLQSVEIREARAEEYDETGRVIVAAYREFSTPGDPGWEEYNRTLADVAGRAGRTIVLVAAEQGRILGSATIEMDRTVGDDDEVLPPDVAALRMLGVLPEARGRGVGRALVRATIDRCVTRRKRELVLRTTEPMVIAQRLYRSLGFERDPDRDMRFEDGFVLYAYRLELSPSSTGP
jgi:ribosomal protein S18 acetylase RimI-like enzyme